MHAAEPPDLTLKVQHLRSLRVRVQAKLHGHIDPGWGADVLETIDQIVDLPDTNASILRVISSHVDRCIVFAEKWLSF